MGHFVAECVIKSMLSKNIQLLGAKILMLGMTFKEDCPDIRNTKAIDIYAAFKEYSMDVDVYEPWADADEMADEYGIDCLTAAPHLGAYDAIIICVGHREFVALGAAGIRAFGKDNSILYDVKGILPLGSADGRL